MTKVLVTGVAGFIGNALANLFCSLDGYTVVGWDRINTKFVFFYEVVDLNRIDLIKQKLSEVRPDLIFHCAGSADVNKSMQFPEEDFAGNVVCTHNLLFALHDLGLNKCRIVYLSSAAVYGNPTKLPVNESARLSPLSPYALHKVMCEELCGYFINNYGFDIKIARIFSAYGRGLKKQIFWDMCNKYKSTGRLEMYGNGLESRDYIHISDVVQSLYLLSTTDVPFIHFNVACGEELTISKVAIIFSEIAKIDSSLVTFNGKRMAGVPVNWCADISRLRSIGFKKMVDIREGLEDYYKWSLSVGI